MSTTLYYVDAASGDDGNTGLSLAQAWRTLTFAATNVPASDFNLYCFGTFLENVTFTGKSRFLISGLNPEIPSQFQVNGYVVLDPGTVTDLGSDLYSFTPTGNVMIGQLGYDYVGDTREDEQPQAFIPRAADLAEVGTTANRWWQDTTTKLVTVHPHASMLPPDDELADWCWFRTGNGLRLAGCSFGEIRSCVQYGWVGGDTTTGLPSIDTGYGVLINTNGTDDSHDIICRDWTVRGFGGHAFGGVTGQYNVQFINCTARTGRQGIGATAFVFHSNAGNSASELSGDRWTNCTAYCDGLLDLDGAHIATGPLNGFYTHGGSGVVPLDVEGTGCYVYAITGTECRFAYGSGVTTATIADEKVYAQYPVRFSECAIVDGHGQQMVLADPATEKYQIAFQRCYLETTLNGQLTTETYLWNIEGTASRVLFDDCVIVGSDNDADTGGMRLFNLANSPTVVFLNCALINSPGAAAQPHFYYNAQTPIVKAYGTLVMASTTNSRLVGGAVTVLSTQTIFVGCWYYKFTPTTGYNNTDSSLNSDAEWTAAIDPTGKYAVDPAISTADLGAITPTVNGAIYVTTQANGIHGAIGINGNLYDNHFGPWQYGPAEATGELTGRAAFRTRNFRNLVR